MIQAYQRQQFKMDIDLNHFNKMTSKIRKKLYYAERKVFDVMAQWSVKHMGVSYLSNENLSKLARCSLRTVQNVTKSLAEKGYISKIYTYMGKRQTSNTIVINPVLFFDMVSISKREELSDNCTPVAPNTFTDTILLKQDIFNDIELNSDEIKLAKMAVLKAKGRKIDHPSSYMDKIFDDIEQDAYNYAVKQNKEKLKANNSPLMHDIFSTPNTNKPNAVPVNGLFGAFKQYIDGQL